MTYLLCHGFGFGNDYWKNLIPLLDDEYEFYDSDFKISSEKSYVGIGHSLGFLKLNNSGIKFRALIGLQGFLNFCGSEPIQRANLQKNLMRMMEKCERNPKRFIEFFRSLCGFGVEDISQSFLQEDLINDLKEMQKAYEHCQVPTLIIGSHQDGIVQEFILRDNFENKNLIDLKFVDGVNHTLGFSKPDKVFELIKSFLEGKILCAKN